MIESRATGKKIEYLEIESPTTGKKIEYRVDLDAREFKGRAGMPWLIMAANVNLSIDKLLDVMSHYGYERTRSWVSRRRWLFFDSNYVCQFGRAADADGQQARAYRIMDQYPNVSSRELVRILGKAGVKRGKDWVLKHRIRGRAVC
jgi:hypothetical protein